MTRLATKLLACASLAALALVAALPAAAQDFPTRPVQILIGGAPGGALDIPTRWVALKLAEVWGKPVVADFRQGASGNIAAEAVAKAAPDGHMLLYITNNFILSSITAPDLTFDPLKDFASVALITAPGQTLLVARPGLGFKNVKDYIAYAKKNPGKLTYGSSGIGSSLHLYGEMLKSMTGIDIVHVPYKGAGPAMNDLVAGRLDSIFVGMAGALPFVKSGKAVALGGAAKEKNAAMPDLPSIHEQGVTGFDGGARHGIIAPAKTPTAIIGKINSALIKVAAMPDTKKTFEGAGIDPLVTTPAEADAWVRDQIVRWKKVIEVSGVKIE